MKVMVGEGRVTLEVDLLPEPEDVPGSRLKLLASTRGGAPAGGLIVCVDVYSIGERKLRYELRTENGVERLTDDPEAALAWEQGGRKFAFAWDAEERKVLWAKGAADGLAESFTRLG